MIAHPFGPVAAEGQHLSATILVLKYRPLLSSCCARIKWQRGGVVASFEVSHLGKVNRLLDREQRLLSRCSCLVGTLSKYSYHNLGPQFNHAIHFYLVAAANQLGVC